ncbi:uncharacterized protein LOC111622495 [Centruroides sculpturatus]|nr:uncharacterized protein LOC111622495 [Centruroides sculpturatus]
MNSKKTKRKHSKNLEIEQSKAKKVKENQELKETVHDKKENSGRRTRSKSLDTHSSNKDSDLASIPACTENETSNTDIKTKTSELNPLPDSSKEVRNSRKENAKQDLYSKTDESDIQICTRKRQRDLSPSSSKRKR